MYFLYLSLGVAALVIVLHFIDASAFDRILGNINPFLTTILSIILAFAALSYLSLNTRFEILTRRKTSDYVFIIGIPLLFGLAVIIADIWLVRYPEEINLGFPESMLFYPVVGFIAEVWFHLIPMTLLIASLKHLTRLPTKLIIWISIIAAAMTEPVFQILFPSDPSLLRTIYTGIHVFAFSITQLLIFKRYDFFSMYIFRLVFYLLWHIVWGELRLTLLF